ncbi:MAG: hypothetical protein N0A15_04600 [Anaerolineae bacterium]|nr:hypothetical protein [Anaerolineae bacterium]
MAEGLGSVPGQEHISEATRLAQRLVEVDDVGVHAVVAVDHGQRGQAAAVLPQGDAGVVAQVEGRFGAHALVAQGGLGEERNVNGEGKATCPGTRPSARASKNGYWSLPDGDSLELSILVLP